MLQLGRQLGQDGGQSVRAWGRQHCHEKELEN